MKNGFLSFETLLKVLERQLQLFKEILDVPQHHICHTQKISKHNFEN